MKMTTKYDYPELYSKLKDFTLDSCNLLSDYYKKEEYADKIEGSPFKKSSGTEVVPLFFLEEPIIDGLFDQKFLEIRDQESFQNLQKYIEKGNLMFWNEAIDFPQFYFYLAKEFRFDQEIFNHLYNRMIKRKFKKEERDRLFYLCNIFQLI